MIAVYFIYGLAFFILGIAIAIYPKQHSKFLLAENVWLIAVFGILHGLNEWVDMFIMIQKPFDKGYWNQIEMYIRDHSEAEFSHGICPECAKKLYPGI